MTIHSLVRSGLVALVVVGCASALAAQELRVVFEVNDAQVKDLRLGEVAVEVRAAGSSEALAAGVTGDDGRFAASLAAGSYQVSYRCPGYVPYTSAATVIRGDGQLVTVSLSRQLEASDAAARQVRVILNWGSAADQVRDADSHLVCVCPAAAEVMYNAKLHEGEGHRVELDVDDTDWGGPETVTLSDPPAGLYRYWVRDFSDGPGTLGTSDVVVRVVIGDAEAGEFRALKGVATRSWRPFRGLEVGADGQVTVVRFTPDEIAEGLDLRVADDQPPEPSTSAGGASEPVVEHARERSFVWLAVVAAVAVAALAARRRRRR